MKSDKLSKLHEIDSGRFSKILNCLNIKDVCFECGYYNPKKINKYRCKCITSCMAATLNPSIISYLLWKTGEISDDEHSKNLGLK